MEKLPIVLDLTGTFVFALSGALAGVKRKLDLFGVLVLSFAAATSGGIARDVLIGAIPPAAVDDWRYLAVSLFAGVVTFYFSPLIVRMWNPVLLFDAAGLSLFAVAGASKALAYGLNPVMAISLGMVHGYRWWHGARRIAGRNPNSTACRTLRSRGAGRRSRRGDRACLAVAGRSGDGRGIDPVLLAPRHGDQTRLEATRCENHGSA
jgi:hypothetical protein